MGVLLALCSAFCYGVADFVGGLLSRRADGATVALLGQLGGLLLTLVAAPFVPASAPAPSDLGWGALSGVGTGVGMLFLYRGLGRGRMSVVVPLSAVAGLALPVLAGVALLGDRPSVAAWLGIAVAGPALWLVAQARDADGRAVAAGTGHSLIAGLGIALQYLALAQAGPTAGIWPVVAGRVTATLTIVPAARGADPHQRVDLRLVGSAGLTGGVAALALVCYLLATREELVSVAVVLSSLYPVVPVLLGIVVLRERLTRSQAAGLLAAGLATALITGG